VCAASFDTEIKALNFRSLGIEVDGIVKDDVTSYSNLVPTTKATGTWLP